MEEERLVRLIDERGNVADVDGLVHVDHFAGGTEPVEELPEIFVDGVS